MAQPRYLGKTSSRLERVSLVQHANSMTTEQPAEGKDEAAASPAPNPQPPLTPTRASNERTKQHPRDGADRDEEEEEEEESEPKLKYNRLTGSLGPVYRNGDATSSSLVAGDKMVFYTLL